MKKRLIVIIIIAILIVISTVFIIKIKNYKNNIDKVKLGEIYKIKGEEFYLLDSEDDYAILVSKYMINKDELKQSSKNYSKVSFSHDNFWKGTVEKYPEERVGSIEKSIVYTYIDKYAKSINKKATGSLITVGQYFKLKKYFKDEKLDYWISNFVSDEEVLVCSNNRLEGINYLNSNYGIRPVIKIRKKYL